MEIDMTDTKQPEALRLADQLRALSFGGTCILAAAELRRQHARIVELEAQPEAVGAGGVSIGPLMGQAQEMPDLTTLTERGAKAWAGVDAQGLREGFTAADMATAEARGFRDVAASAMAGEPMAWMTFTEEGDPDMVFLDRLEACQYCEDDDPPKPLYLAAPPTAQAEGWRPSSTAPRDGAEVLADTSGLGHVVNSKDPS